MVSRAVTQLLTRAGWRFFSGTFSRLVHVLHQLWHEIVGTLFLALGAAAIPAVIREWRGESKTRAALTIIFLVTMVYFGITSFVRARKVASRLKEPRP